MSYLQPLAGMIFVLALVSGLAWLLRRGAITLPGRGNRAVVRVEAATPLGERRSLVVVNVEGRRLLLGLTPMQVSLVTELAAGAFDQALDRRVEPRS